MIGIIILFLLILCSAFFSMSETALTCVSRIKIKQMLEEKKYGSKSLNELWENPSRMISTILIGSNGVNMTASALAVSFVIIWFEKMGIGHVGLAVGVVTGVVTFLILAFGEIVPKTIAIKKADSIALFVAPIIEVMAFILNPIVILLNYFCRPLIKMFGGILPTTGPLFTSEEIKTILSMGEEQGVIEEEEREMIHSIFEFGETIVREVMTPRPDMQSIDSKENIRSAVEVFAAKKHSRIPVHEGSIDNITGIVYAKDLFLYLDKDVTAGEIARPALFVPEGKKLDELLHQMQGAKTHIAIVVDEYGGTSGLVTMEDLIEEIVGEIQDEFDKEEKTVEFIDDNTAIVDGRLSIADTNERLERLDVRFPEGDYDTIGGFIFVKLGKLPAVGNRLRYENYEITVEKILKRRITRIRIFKIIQNYVINVGNEGI